jgi:mitochondrial chaperone BCS1
VRHRCILLLEDLDAAFTRSVTRDATSTGTPTAATTSTGAITETTDGSTLSLSGLLNSLDGVAAAEGRYVDYPLDRYAHGPQTYKPFPLHYDNSLLFATTNHIERLDPALSRPGRMDIWVNFTHATKWQAEGIFKCFFPSKPSAPASTSADAVSTSAMAPKDNSQKNMPVPKRKAFAHAVPLLDEEEISELAERFAEAIPEDELSVRLRRDSVRSLSLMVMVDWL